MGLLVFWCFHATGAEWTDEQKEVWQAVEADTELFKKGDVEAIMADRHVEQGGSEIRHRGAGGGRGVSRRARPLSGFETDPAP